MELRKNTRATLWMKSDLKGVGFFLGGRQVYTRGRHAAAFCFVAQQSTYSGYLLMNSRFSAREHLVKLLGIFRLIDARRYRIYKKDQSSVKLGGMQKDVFRSSS